MDGAFVSYQGFSAQDHLDDDLMLSEDEFDLSQDNALLSSDGEDDQALFDDDFVYNHIAPAQCHNDSSPHEEEFDFDIPQHLPAKALSTESASLLHEDGHVERYLTILNSPIGNYVAQNINDGHEFAIGGDPAQILKSLEHEFAFRPQQRWHVVVVPEDNLRLVGAPRKAYPLVSGMTEDGFQSVKKAEKSEQNIGYGDTSMNGGPVGFPSHSYDGQGLNSQADRDLLSLDQLQQDGGYDDSMTNGGPVNLSHGDASSAPTPSHDFAPMASTPFQANSVQYDLSSEYNKQEASVQDATDDETFLQEEEEKIQKREDAATIETDTQWADYSGTGLCRWCGRRGHEAVQCIKWDPDQFDKAVCVACNNKKHTIDECNKFLNLSNEEKIKLLVVEGAKKPGVRSYFWPWTCYAHDLHNKFGLDPSVTAFPMTRAFIQRLTSDESNGTMWTNLWKTFPYGGYEAPHQFHDRDLVLESQDESSDAIW